MSHRQSNLARTDHSHGRIQRPTLADSLRQLFLGQAPVRPGSDHREYFAVPRPISSEHCAILALDASPSMMDSDWPPTRLKAAQEAGCAYVHEVARDDPDAQIAIVSYSMSAKVRLGLTPACEIARLEKAIKKISVSSATNISSGLAAAIKLLKDCDGANQIVLLTDGDHNWGSSPLDLIEELHKAASVECVGIGGNPKDVNEDLLRAIASARPDGSKRYRWIGDKDQLIEHFRQAAGRLMRA